MICARKKESLNSPCEEETSLYTTTLVLTTFCDSGKIHVKEVTAITKLEKKSTQE